MRNKALTDSVLILCLSIVLFADKKIKRRMKGDSCTDENPRWFPPFYGHWSDSTQGSFLTKWEGLGDKVATNLRRMELANILSEWIQKSSRGSTPLEPPLSPPTRSLQEIRQHLFYTYCSISDLVHLRAFLHTTLELCVFEAIVGRKCYIL